MRVAYGTMKREVAVASMGSDLNGGVAAVIGELDHDDAGTRKMDAWGTWRGHSK
ncbi:hypothetical protein C1H46_011195 [Malus baccata]|uniref:Uncharacterized protein n=1 Tax=Malus baccata TaxID=106549 RepID=A0A540MWM4_MALBA|nr:hypothetical protein C1H46_011195 [Malus baccata]